MNNELTFHVKVEAAQADPALEYEALLSFKIHLCMISRVFPFVLLTRNCSYRKHKV